MAMTTSPQPWLAWFWPPYMPWDSLRLHNTQDRVLEMQYGHFLPLLRDLARFTSRLTRHASLAG